MQAVDIWFHNQQRTTHTTRINPFKGSDQSSVNVNHSSWSDAEKNDTGVTSKGILTQISEVSVPGKQSKVPSNRQSNDFTVSSLRVANITQPKISIPRVLKNFLGLTPHAMVQKKGEQGLIVRRMVQLLGYVYFFTIKALFGKEYTSEDVLYSKVWIPMPTNIFRRNPTGKQFEDVRYGNPGSLDAGPAMQNTVVNDNPVSHYSPNISITSTISGVNIDKLVPENRQGSGSQRQEDTHAFDLKGLNRGIGTALGGVAMGIVPVMAALFGLGDIPVLTHPVMLTALSVFSIFSMGGLVKFLWMYPYTVRMANHGLEVKSVVDDETGLRRAEWTSKGQLVKGKFELEQVRKMAGLPKWFIQQIEQRHEVFASHTMGMIALVPFVGLPLARSLSNVVAQFIERRSTTPDERDKTTTTTPDKSGNNERNNCNFLGLRMK